MRGSLTVVGTGIKGVAHVTIEARSAVAAAEKVFFLLADPISRAWLQELNPRSESLHDCFAVGKPRNDSYDEIVARLLQAVRTGHCTAAVFYGHPGVFVRPSHEAIRQARAEGFAAEMLPGISAEDCLFADLGIEPAQAGCQSFEATDFVLRRRRPDTTCSVILWQAGLVGRPEHVVIDTAASLELLGHALREHYAGNHKVTLYEASQFAVCAPLIHHCTVNELPTRTATVLTTLYVPPAAAEG